MALGPAIARAWRSVASSDVFYSFRSSKVTVAAAIVTAIIFVACFAAPLISIQDPYDPANFDLSVAMRPPVLWGGDWDYPLGTDDQGRDMYSAILYGTRLSLIVGFASVLLAMALGVTIGLVSGYVGGATDAVLMRAADVQLTFPAFLIALTLDGVVRGLIQGKVWLFKYVDHDAIALPVIIVSLGLAFWPQYARTVRGTVLVERTKDYVNAARIIGVRPWRILWRHILPNAMGPVLVIATINLAVAIITEATLSFLGVGMPKTQPSLGTLIQIGNDYLSSGDLWITVSPGIMLAVLVLAVNLLGDWLRDALNPKLR
jgi:peptide/nickel transport system permease protein